MEESRERLRLILQIVLVVIAAGAAIGAAWRYQSTRVGGDDPTVTGPTVRAQPSAGPVGMRPLLAVLGFDEDTTVRVLFCAPGSDVAECVELGTGRVADRIRSAPLPAALTVDGQRRDVVPGSYDLRAGPPGGATPAVVGSIDIVPFQLGPPPAAKSFAGVDVSSIRLGGPAEVARSVVCETRFTPDNRLILGSSLLDHRTAVSVDFPLRGAELSWSPRRDRLALITEDRKEIRMASPDGSSQDVVVREARGLLSSLSWSPHADRLAYVASPQPGVRGGPARPTVMILDLTTGAQNALRAGEWVAWSPVGDRLAVEAVEGGTRSVLLVGLDNTASRLVEGRRPAWSPDGRLLAFVRPQQGSGFVVRADSPQAAAVATGGVCGMAFSADGKWMAVVNLQGDATQLVIRPIETGGRGSR